MLEYALTLDVEEGGCLRTQGKVGENKDWSQRRRGNSYWTFVDRKPHTIHYDTHLQVGTEGYGDRHISLKDQTVSLPSRWL